MERKSHDLDEKAGSPDLRHIDDSAAAGTDSDIHPDDHGFTEKEQRSIISRIDRRLVVTVGAMYCVSLMDRTNMSAANIAGMSVELNLGANYVRLSPCAHNLCAVDFLAAC
jgi:hypothetical protein